MKAKLRAKRIENLLYLYFQKEYCKERVFERINLEFSGYQAVADLFCNKINSPSIELIIEEMKKKYKKECKDVEYSGEKMRAVGALEVIAEIEEILKGG